MAKARRPGEFELIRRYFAPLAAGAPGALGLTDDAALVRARKGRELVVTTDILVAGVHFPPDETPDSVAARALGVNLSDLAAMGAKPRAYTLAIALAGRCDSAWLRKFAAALDRLQKIHGISLIGGDTVATTGPLTVSVTAIGDVPTGAALRRDGAKAGDAVYVSGTIGDAALGLKVVQGKLRGLKGRHRKTLVERYRRPRPRLRLGQALVGLARAAIDVSDGLVADLGHIAETSGLTAEIDIARVPLSAAAAAALADDPGLLATVLAGGDDYEILFTAPVAAGAALARLARRLKLPLTRVGVMKKGKTGAVRLKDRRGRTLSLARTGYQHF